MPRIELQTRIRSSVEICFDLSTSIELHTISTSSTNEKAIAGITTGFIKLDEFVTWEATHFGFRQRLTSKITLFDRPLHFRDEQVKGIFRSIVHDHFFRQEGAYVVMTDIFEYESPFGVLGKLFNTFVLTSYLTRFLRKRNQLIKEYAETGKWKELRGVQRT